MILGPYAIAHLVGTRRLAAADSVLRPFHLGQIDALVVHVVQRAERAELLDRRDDLLDRVVDLVLRRPAAQRQAERAVGQLVADAQALEDVAGLEARARAGAAAGAGDLLDGHHEALAL